MKMELKKKVPVSIITPTSNKVQVRSCAANTCKGLLNLFNLLFGISGLGIITISTWVLRHGLSQDLAIIMNSQLYRLGAVIIVVAGCAIVVISIIGFFGIRQENKCFLLGYVTTFIIVFGMVFVAGVFSVAIYTRAENQLEYRMMNTLTRQYGPGGNDNANDPITSAWNNIQETFKCCGVKTNTSGGQIYKRSSNWYRDQPIVRRKKVPSSCCTKTGGNFVNLEHCGQNFKGYEYVYSKGCYDSVIQQISIYVCLVSGCVIGVTVIQIFGLLFSYIVMRQL